MSHPRLAPLAAHVFVDNLDAPALSADDAHHLLRVLRLRDGDAISVSDGAGGWLTCVVRTSGGLEATSAIERATPPKPLVTVGFALTKGDKPEFTVQKLCEVGVDRIMPIQAARSVVRWDQTKAARNVERWRSVARAAAMQARRVWLPEVTDVITPASVVGPGVAFAHPGGRAITLGCPTVLVGPEGGWDDDEAALAAQHVDLGPTTLRAETAAIAVGVVLTALRDGRIGPVDMSVSPE